jgi:hypothetical protein
VFPTRCRRTVTEAEAAGAPLAQVIEKVVLKVVLVTTEAAEVCQAEPEYQRSVLSPVLTYSCPVDPAGSLPELGAIRAEVAVTVAPVTDAVPTTVLPVTDVVATTVFPVTEVVAATVFPVTEVVATTVFPVTEVVAATEVNVGVAVKLIVPVEVIGLGWRPSCRARQRR